MKDRFQGKDYLTIMDWKPEEINYILDISAVREA
jgi:ornithine carbamoyltransferase